MTDPVIAVDLGGTNLRAAYFKADKPQPDAIKKIPTNAGEGLEAVLGRLIETIESVAPENPSGLRIGVGVPGFVDSKTGIIHKLPNIPGWEDVPLQKTLSDHFQCAVRLGNDANVAALGEARHGAGKGSQDVLYLTISTGIGGGVITNGHLLEGARGLGAELGHILVNPEGPVCSCGKFGHLEAYASGPSIARRAEERIGDDAESSLAQIIAEGARLRARDIGAAAYEGDALAMEVVREAAMLIGQQLASLVHIFNPEFIIIGGGVSQIGSPLLDPLESTMRELVIDPAYLDPLEVAPAALKDDAGLVGSMVLARSIQTA